MKIVITGRTGFIGRHLARRLIGEGHQAVLLARGAADHEVDPASRFVPSDLSDAELLAESFSACDAVALRRNQS